MYSFPSLDPTSPTTIGFPGLEGLDLPDLGIPNREEFVGAYLEGYKRTPEPVMFLTPPTLIPSWVLGFYTSFLFFKNAVISHGVKQRYLEGLASSDKAREVGELSFIAVAIGRELLEEYMGAIGVGVGWGGRRSKL